MLFFIGFSPIELVAVRHSGDGSVANKSVRKIDLDEGRKRIEHFRDQRLAGDFSLKFELKHMPRRESPVTYEGIMWGTWNEIGPVFRVQIWPKATGPQGMATYIIQSGPNPRVWLKETGSESIQELDTSEMLEPIFRGLLYSPYDLVMPFAYWQDFDYEGTDRVKGRPAYIFLMQPPSSMLKEFPDMGPVRIVLDANFNALLKAEWLDKNKSKKRSFKMLNFKKVSDQWIVKTVDLVDYKTHDKTRFEVTQAALNLNLSPQSYFEPESLNTLPNPIGDGFYDSL